jgi:hypothetical protein
MFQSDLFPTDEKEALGLPALLERLATVSRRPRYTYMVLNLIAKAAGSTDGSVAKIVKLEHAWRRLDGRNDDGFQVAPFPG